MKKCNRLCASLLLMLFLVELFAPGLAMAADAALPPAPVNMDVHKTGTKYDIVYDAAYNGYSVTLNWGAPTGAPDPLDIPNNGQIEDSYYEIYTSIDNKNFTLYPERVGNVTSYTVKGLESGRVYYAYVKAVHIHKDDEGKEVTHSSLPSNTVIFMTDIDVEVTSAGIDALQIEWDDVWFGTKRIGYDIYISGSPDFADQIKYMVRQEQISNFGPVFPPASGDRRLKLTAKGSTFNFDAGKIYYVKIVPVINDSRVRCNPESKTIPGYTQISAAIYKKSEDWWKIEWLPVTNSSGGGTEKIKYTIYRGQAEIDNPVLVQIFETTDTKCYVNTAGGKYFFLVVADIKDGNGNSIIVDKNGYAGVKSARLYPKEGEQPTEPPTPEIKDMIRRFEPDGEILYKYSTTSYSNGINKTLPATLTPTSATVAWLTPKTADGKTIDEDVVYDIWLETNYDNLSEDRRKITLSNFDVIPDSGTPIAYKHSFANLRPNTTYYLKIVARKSYIIDLKPAELVSAPSYKVIVTPTDGEINQPVAPARPPLRIKKVLDESGNETTKEDVGSNYAWIQWDNQWYEHWNATDKKWETVTKAVYDANSGDSNYRYSYFDNQVTFRVGSAPIQELVGTDGKIDYEKIRNRQYVVVSNILRTADITKPQNERVPNLRPNSTYVVWLWAYRANGELWSEPSDPVIIVTKPDSGEDPETPAVPALIYSKAGDIYVDLQWVTKDNYTYYIKYSKADNANSATNKVTITPKDLAKTKVYRISNLEQNTVYYFWLQAESTGANNQKRTSQWSDTYIVKTLPYIPPETPKGFGIKNTTDAVGKNHITYEWIKNDGLTYILEIGSDITYKDGKEYPGINAGEYKVDGLRSNYRYWARLYAYDPVKKLRSEPTQSITIMTPRSNDDYDSDVDTDNVITGPFVEEDYSSGTWTVKVIGVNADRFIEKIKTDTVLDYKFDLTKKHSGAKKRVILVSNRVFTALSELKENINIDSGFSVYTIRPHVMDSDQVKQIASKPGEVNVEFTIVQQTTSYGTGDYTMSYESSPSDVAVKVISGTQMTPLKNFNNPLKVAFPYTSESLFADGKVNGYVFDETTNKWNKQLVSTKFDKLLNKGYASFDMKAPGSAALLRKAILSSSFYDIGGHPAESAITAVCSKFELPSVGTGYFKPYQTMTIGDASKLMMDVLGYKYGESFAESAAKTGFISASDISDTGKGCTRKQFLLMLDKLYSIKAGEKAGQRYFTAADNQTISRGDAMIELYYTLTNLGEL
ncbi:MAG: fibronectin type III domain-containing protein [Clostridia bacterium]|nr:fibronectin type III domain-containing protein [Clostridia bacterium]